MIFHALIVAILSFSPTFNGFSDNSWYYESWCCGNTRCLVYLDDGNCDKKFPSNIDREWTCPNSILETPPNASGYVSDQDILSKSGFIYMSKLPVDTVSLAPYVTNGANLCMIITKRVQIQTGSPTLYNKYFCTGDASKLEAYETWSSSKIFAMANAAGRLRSNESICEPDGPGLDSSVLQSKHDQLPLGDLATIIASYDTTAGYSSNSLSSYFHDIGFRDRANWLVNTWLGAVHGADLQSLGGNYGEATPLDLGFILNESNSSNTCLADIDPALVIYDNTISALSAAEMLRRLVNHEFLPQALQFPGLTGEDIKAILYGAQESSLFPGLQWGGMMVDTAIFVQSAVDIKDVDAKSHGLWRIFSKLGAGWSTSRSRGEVVTTAYACFPSLDELGIPISGEGFELSISARGSVVDDISLMEAETVVLEAVKGAISALINNKLEV